MTDEPEIAEHDPFSPAPPQNLDAEESILGAMMMSAAAIDAVSEVLVPGDFYRKSHAQVYQAALTLHAAGNPVDAITVADELELRGQLKDPLSRERLHELVALVPATSNAAHYARIVREMATLRGLITVGELTQRLGWERPKPAAELVDMAEGYVFELAKTRQRTDFIMIGDTLADTFRRIEALSESGKEIIGCPSGFKALDELTAGFQASNLVIVAARPSMGKSAFALSVAHHVAVKQRLPVALFTMEMSRFEVTMRLLSAEAHVDSMRLRNGRLSRDEWGRLMHAHTELKTAPLLVDDAGALTLLEIRSKARRVKLNNPGLALVVVDYLQLMSAGGRVENRVQEVSQISRALKVLAGELEVPVVALSQLSRAPEGRHDKRPILSDLRESGSIEQDADAVMFLYRDEYYHPEDAAADGTEGVAEVNLAKQRNGPTGIVKLAFVKRYAQFSDLHSPAVPS